MRLWPTLRVEAENGSSAALVVRNAALECSQSVSSMLNGSRQDCGSLEKLIRNVLLVFWNGCVFQCHELRPNSPATHKLAFLMIHQKRRNASPTLQTMSPAQC